MTTREPVGPRKDHHALNAMPNMYDCDGRIQFDKDREAVRQYFLQHVNPWVLRGGGVPALRRGVHRASVPAGVRP
ncbi:hypothetical protein ACPCBC_02530 [Streptomyces incarnatus]|nr:hypothetical protein [Streptomyces incarnatus]